MLGREAESTEFMEPVLFIIGSVCHNLIAGCHIWALESQISHQYH